MATKTTTITTKYGTKINTTGLTPEQVAKVRATAENKGAYGSKGAALADSFRKAAVVPTKDTKVTLNDGANLQKTDPSQTVNAFMTGANGQQTERGAIDLTNLPKIVGAEDLEKDSGAARDSAFSYITKDYASQKQQEMDAAKQELAGRGIPLDPDPNSLYGKTLDQINKKYQGLEDQAKNQAFQAGNDIFKTESDASNAAYNSSLSGANAVSDAELKLYGITEGSSNQAKQLAMQKIIADRQNKSQEKIAAGQNSTALAVKRLGMGGGGGGGASSADTSPVIGGVAPGFNVSNG